MTDGDCAALTINKTATFCTPQRHVFRGWGRVRRQRRKVVVTAVLAAVLVAGAVYAATPLVDQILPPVAIQNGQEVILSQGACGFTMTITRVYADSNRVVIGYTLSGSAGRTFDPELSFFTTHQAPTLSAAQEPAQPPLFGLGS